MTVKVWRLSSGEEIIGEDVSPDDQYNAVSIKNPAIIQLMQEHPGSQPQMGMGPLLPMAKKDTASVTISKNAIMYEYEPLEGLANEYNAMHGGLVTASTPSLII